MIVTRIFLTGGSGFIGAEIARLALADGHVIGNIDLVEPDIADQRTYWVKGDIRDLGALTQAMADFRPECVIHLASDTDVKITRLEEFTTTIDGTRNVVDAVKAIPGITRLVHISTQFTVKPGVVPPDEEFLEPYTVYGEAKARTERIVRESSLTIDWLLIRPTIIWGPRHPSFSANIFKHIRTRSYLHPVSREPIMRAFGYVTNTADQILKLALAGNNILARKVYYAGDATIDYDQWADAFSVGLTGKKARRIPTALLNLLGTAGDVARKLGLPAPIDSGRAFRMSTSSAIDLSPTLATTGPVPVTFSEGVTATLAWLENSKQLS